MGLQLDLAATSERAFKITGALQLEHHNCVSIYSVEPGVPIEKQAKIVLIRSFR